MAALLAWALPDAASGDVLFDGPEFQVNTYTTNSRYGRAARSVSRSPDGTFVVVWHSFGQDGSSYSVHGQRFDSAGEALGTEFQVNTHTTGGQRYPAVASAGDTSFVVVWESYGQDGSGYGVHGQRFGSAGAALGTEFQVNTYTTSFQTAPAVASAADSSFVVFWSSGAGQDGSSYSVHGQRFDSAGAALGAEFQVNTYTTSFQRRVAVAPAGDSSFVVVWDSFGQDGSSYSVHGQRFGSTGAALGTEFQVNTYTTGQQFYSQSVASDGAGNFVVVWTSSGQDGSSYGMFGQLLCNDADGDGVCDADDVCAGFDDLADADADGVCDADDVCTNVAGTQDITIKPKVILKKINTATTPANDGLALKGEFKLAGTTSFANLDPGTNGARIVIDAVSGANRVDETLPSGAAWSVNGSGTALSYNDKAGTVGGIIKLQIKDRSKKAANQVLVKVKGKKGTYPVVSGDEPIRVTVVLGAAASSAAGECGETVFAAPSCKFNGAGNKLACK